VIAICAGVYFLLPKVIFPSGVWVRRVVHDHPLAHPERVTGIRDGAFLMHDGDYRLAGLTLCEDPLLAAQAENFLRTLTAQGVEIIRPVSPPHSVLLMCDARISHHCGNDPVRAHYTKFNLNELLLAAGMAKFDRDAPGLTENEKKRLAAAEMVAQREKTGIWRVPGEADHHLMRVIDESGIDISEAYTMMAGIEWGGEDAVGSDD